MINCNKMGEAVTTPPLVSPPLHERLHVLEATLGDFINDMEQLTEVIKSELKYLKTAVGGETTTKPSKKAKKRKQKDKEQKEAVATSAAGVFRQDDEPRMTLKDLESILGSQSQAQQRTLDEYLASLSRRLAEDRKGMRRYTKVSLLDRELRGLKENVLHALLLDARKVELIHEKDLKIKELEEQLKREEERERQLLEELKSKVG